MIILGGRVGQKRSWERDGGGRKKIPLERRQMKVQRYDERKGGDCRQKLKSTEWRHYICTVRKRGEVGGMME